MPTYYPTGDGNVTFHDYGCQQVVTRVGLTIDSEAADALLEYGHLVEGDATDETKHRAFPPVLEAVLEAVDGDAAHATTYTPPSDDAPVSPVADVTTNSDSEPTVPEEAQPQGPAAKTLPKGK